MNALVSIIDIRHQYRTGKDGYKPVPTFVSEQD